MNDDTNNYVIRKTRSYYGPSTNHSLIMDESGQSALRFESRAAARAFIAELEEEVYYTAHNESGLADYKVLRADSLPEYLSYYL